MAYLVARDPYEEGDVHIGQYDFAKMRDAYDALRRGARVGAAWPKDARFKHTVVEAIPLGTIRRNALPNSYSFLIVDDKYRAFFAKHAPDDVEMLAVELEIAPRKIVKTGWWIANVITALAAVDRKKSVWKPDVDEGKIRVCSKLVLLPKVIAAEPAVFELVEMRGVYLFRDDLVAAAQKAKLTGLRFSEPAQFNSRRD
jgi:hypothetical protein